MLSLPLIPKVFVDTSPKRRFIVLAELPVLVEINLLLESIDTPPSESTADKLPPVRLHPPILPPLNNTDWINYFDLYKKIPEFTEQNYSMTMQEFKVIFWWEWGHRFLGRVIGILFLLPLIFFTYKEGFKNGP